MSFFFISSTITPFLFIFSLWRAALKERAKFTEQMMDKIFDSADKPLTVCAQQCTSYLLLLIIVFFLFSHFFSCSRVTSGGRQQMSHGRHWLAVWSWQQHWGLLIHQSTSPTLQYTRWGVWSMGGAYLVAVLYLVFCHCVAVQDGSCNGLQHYAALRRDAYGAKQVWSDCM